MIPITPTLSDPERDSFHRTLPEWYRTHRRDLPWRRLQADAYAVWVSETMLQQTQVVTAIPYFERWLAQFPTLGDFAKASEQDALKLWSGLGYYARARNFHRAARIVMERHDGRIPSSRAELSKLPGIGPYTAGALLSICYGLPEPIVDANVARVLCRVFLLSGDPKSRTTSEVLWNLATLLVQNDNPSEFNQAMMELGALICTPGNPECSRCPLSTCCRASKQPDPTPWPQIAPGKRMVREQHAAAWIARDGLTLLVQRPKVGLWGGMWELPRLSCASGEEVPVAAIRAARELTGLECKPMSIVAFVEHAVTHHRIGLHAVKMESVAGEVRAALGFDTRWVSLKDWENLPTSAPQSRIRDILMKVVKEP